MPWAFMISFIDSPTKDVEQMAKVKSVYGVITGHFADLLPYFDEVTTRHCHSCDQAVEYSNIYVPLTRRSIDSIVNMSLIEACCTCATVLADTKVPYDTESEKPLAWDRRLECCGRTICATCQYKNDRFRTYCPYCQISTQPSALPAEGLRLPPSYRDNEDGRKTIDLPPAYDSLLPRNGAIPSQSAIRPPEHTEDTVHFLSPDDTLHSLSLAYRVPQDVLRKHNHLFSDSLLTARKFLLIPRSYYDGPPLSTPPDPEEEERKNKVRRWMIATKCAEYNMAQLYLKGSQYDLEIAIEAFKADEQWEKDHPMAGKGKQKDAHQRKRFGASLTGQLF